MAYSTPPSKAGEAAKRLVGQWAHLKVDQPDVFIATIAAVLAQYPLGIVEECIDPRTGVVNKLRFLNISDLRPWLDERLEYHQALANHEPRLALPEPAKVYAPEHRAGMIERFRALMASLVTGRQDPVDRLRREHRERVEAQHLADKARTLADLEAAE